MTTEVVAVAAPTFNHLRNWTPHGKPCRHFILVQLPPSRPESFRSDVERPHFHLVNDCKGSKAVIPLGWLSW